MSRSSRGSMLAFIVAVLFVIAIFGVACFYLLGWLGGSREALNATEAGNLNIGKQAIKNPSISLNQGVEKDNFSGLADKEDKICLETYNRLTGQMLIVAANAQAQGTSTSANNFKTLLDAFQTSQSSISKRLHDELVSSDNFKSYFAIANANSTRMVNNAPVKNVDESFQTAFVDKQSPTNITLDTGILPDGVKLPSGTLSDKKGGDGHSYINGYFDIAVGKLPPFSGASVHPDEQPHLISRRTFAAALKSPVSGVVPPNAFKSVADVTSGRTLVNVSCATVGAMTGQKYAASIPHGFIVVFNPKGFIFQGHLPNPNSIYNNQLYSGLFLGSNGAFSTSRDALQKWADYNNANPKPGAIPTREGIFDRNGNPISLEEAAKITSLGGGTNAYPVEVDYTMTSGEGALPQVAALVGAMQKAYNASNEQSGNRPELTAVEDLKGRVMMMFANGLTGQVNPPSGYSGVRVFDHQAELPVPAGAPPIISRPGNVTELLDMAGDRAILPDLKKRIRQIKPSASNRDIENLLTSKRIELGERWYIFMDESSRALKMEKTPPPWVTALPRDWQDGTKADGNPVESASIFATLGLSVNPPGEAGFNNALFDSNSDPTSTALATDKAIWTPSSGFNNLLGALQFRESIQGLASETPAQPTPEPTPPPETDLPVTQPPQPTPPPTPQSPPQPAPQPATPRTPPPAPQPAPPWTPQPSPPRAPQPLPPRGATPMPPRPQPSPQPAPQPKPNPQQCSCNLTTCTFPWDHMACRRLGSNATIKDVFDLLLGNGGTSRIRYEAMNPETLWRLTGGTGLNASTLLEGAVGAYFLANRQVESDHRYDASDAILRGRSYLKDRNYGLKPGSGAAFLNWFNQSNCGKPLIIVDQLN